MAVENIILSREGFSEINKLCNYMASLIIKNDAEASEYETEHSFNNYCKYEASYTGAKSIFLYSYDYKDLNNFFPADYIHNKNLLDPNVINDLVLKGDKKAIAFVEDLEIKFIQRYVEYNQYYRQFMGTPLDVSDKLFVENLDSDNPKDLDISKINPEIYPNTYDYWFVKRNIDILMNEHPDLVYLKFIENPISPYRLRKLPDYSILFSYDTLLNEDEQLRFSKAYNKARIYVTEQLYVNGQARRYPLYGNLVLLLILYYTVCNYFNNKLEDYSLRKYTRYDLYDILESNGLKNLTKISDLELLKKIVLNLDELNQYKGTEYALEQIFHILNDNSITVRRYNLVKEFRTDNQGILEFDTDKMYIDSVGLKFKEVPIIMDKTSNLNTTTKYLNYDERTMEDNLWGGVDAFTDDPEKRKLKNRLKRDIIKMDFDEVRTKYLSISKAMNIYEKSTDTISMLYLTMKYYYDYANILNTNPFEDYEINFQAIKTTPIALFGSICYLTNIINETSEPEKISPDRNFLYSVYLLRTTSSLNEQIKDICNTEIDIGNPLLKTTIGSILGNKKEVEKYLTKYRLNQFSTLSDVFAEYEKNKEVINLLKSKISVEQDALLYYTWRELENYNKSVYDFSYMFEEFTNMREYLSEKSPRMLAFIDDLFKNVTEENHLTILSVALQNMITKFEEFMNMLLKDIKFFSFDASREDVQYLEDLRILMNEYISIFSELYSVEQTIVLQDPPNNIIKTMFVSLANIFKSEYFEKLETKWVIRKRKIKDIKKDFIKFKEVMRQIIKDYKKDKITLTFILRNIRSYFTVSDTTSVHAKNIKKVYKDTVNDSLNMHHKLTKINITE